ncbi:20493_t:CDS:2, partial [Gigaspora rosea]
MMKTGYCSAVFLSLLALVLVLLSFVGVNPEVPKQVPYRFTGYLSWLPKLEGYDDNMLDAATLFNIITMLLSSYYALKWAYNPPTNPKLITRFYSAGDRDATSSPTIDFDRALAIYIVTTLLAGAALFFVGAGKIWVAVGIFHNASEFIILIMLGSGGKIKSSSSTFWPILGFYIFIISITCTLFKFPYDALWFKGQGLCFDWALIIEFT